jgi:hypothetical protein
MLRNDLLDSAMDEHAQWLQATDAARAERFQSLRQSHREGAAAEALVAACFRSWVNTVEPSEDPASGGPDYLCTQKGQRFYVEVTTLATAAVEKASLIPDDPHWKGGTVGSISRIVRSSISDKVRQCSNRDAPVLVALGVHHSWISMGVDGLAREILISDEAYWPAVSAQSPIPTGPGDFVTHLSNALFMAVDANGVTPKRQPVSAVLVFGLGVKPPQVVGVVNSGASRPFDVCLLPQVAFAEAVVADGRVGIRWHNRQ